MRSLVLVSLVFLFATASLSAQDRVALRTEEITAARDVFLKIEDIEGESQDKDHRGWIELESWSWGAVSPGRALSAAVATFPPPAGSSEITLESRTTKATPKLYEVCAKGKILESVELTRRDADGRFHGYVLENARITSYSVSNTTGTAPIETVSFNFEKIDYRPPPVAPRPAIRDAQDR